MTDSFFLLALIGLIAFAVGKGKPSFLPVLVSLEFAINRVINEILVSLEWYTLENLSSIMLLRLMISGVTAILILKHRRGLNWVFVGLVYAIVLLFQFAVFVESTFVSGVLVSNYSLVIQTLSALIVLALVDSQCGISHRLRPLLFRYHATFPSTERHSKGNKP